MTASAAAAAALLFTVVAGVIRLTIPQDPLPHLIAFLRRRRFARRALSVLSAGLLVGAAVMISYPFYTNMYQSRVQARLDRQLASPQIEQDYLERSVGVGDSLTRIVIDAIDLETAVVEGTTASALRAGAGHYPATPLPCEPGNVAIAGHRTTYGRPFHNVDRLKPGDTIVLETPVGSCTYVLEREPFVVRPSDTWVVEPTAASLLTLTTCEPKGSARLRLIVQATLQGQAEAA